MRHRIPIIGIVMIVTFAALTGGGVWTQTGVGIAPIVEAVPERRIPVPNLKGKKVQGRPPDEVELRVSEEIMIAKENVDGDGAAGVIKNNHEKSVMQSPVPSDILTNGPILAAG